MSSVTARIARRIAGPMISMRIRSRRQTIKATATSKIMNSSARANLGREVIQLRAGQSSERAAIRASQVPRKRNGPKTPTTKRIDATASTTLVLGSTARSIGRTPM